MYRIGIVVALLAGLVSFAGGGASAKVCLKPTKYTPGVCIDQNRLPVNLELARRAPVDLGEFYEILAKVCNRDDPTKPCDFN